MNPVGENHSLMKLVKEAGEFGRMTTPRFPNQCCGYVTNRWGYAGPCQCIGTVLVNGRLYCLTCARKAAEK